MHGGAMPQAGKGWKEPPCPAGSIERPELVAKSLLCAGPGELQLLDLAVAAGNIPNVKFLLANGASPEALTDYDRNSLFMRCVDISSVFVQRLERDRPMKRRAFAAPRVNAEKRQEAYEFLVTAGADINYQNGKGLSPLHSCNDPEVLQWLLARGANLELQAKPWSDSISNIGATPLQYRLNNIPSGDSRYERVPSELEKRARWLAAVKLLGHAGNHDLRNTVNEYRVCRQCSRARDGFPSEVCETLKANFVFREGVFKLDAPASYCEQFLLGR
jgi:ankyrin repeat protein